MLIDWTHWLSSLTPDQVFWLLAPLVVMDITRYVAGSIYLFACDMASEIGRALGICRPEADFDYCPSVCVVVAGLNEAATIEATLHSLWDTYPAMQIVIVDDGSSDGMYDVAHAFAEQHDNVLVLRKPQRGGKSSALNFALPFVDAEIVVCVDGDSHVGENGIWEIVQPFQDPQVGAVSAAVLARNPHDKLITWMQAYEYLRCIFVGRMIASKLDILGIISGAFGAYRADAIKRMKGWDVGPGEDGDLSLRLRKCGYKIAFAPYAQCFTNLPTKWWTLVKQRRRWEWAVITFECRKHVDMGNIFSPNFRWSNLGLLLERWTYSVFMTYLTWIFLALYGIYWWHENSIFLIVTYYLCYLLMELVLLALALYYSNSRWRDLKIGFVAPLSPLYNLFMRAITCWAITEELLTRRSFRDNFVPEHVRDVTWHW